MVRFFEKYAIYDYSDEEIVADLVPGEPDPLYKTKIRVPKKEQ